ncbi:flavoprotein [Acetobacterium woodii]|uniref:Flavoprotein n=1 Tax=Acetobacterium woodii (strain ATCC 29683 / DSM 1030 / JCM 2381 / KCTC 1655 / WB1) TaxID=931626 RepID=H6LEP5_ACEWD|nr:flavoprotein [Acetobacterium woodii]AFA49338.1 flavoprotein [Acetobacterium woodii DSM 1030]
MEKILENGLLDGLIQKIVDEVVRRIKNQPKKAVVFFTGASIGFRESMDSLLKLQKDGWQLKVVLSDDGMKVLDPGAIQNELNLDVIYHSGNIKSQKELYGSADMFVIATMSVNTAAKLAVGITDTVLLSLVNHGFMAGTPVVAAINACNPDDPQRAALGMGKSSPKYREMLINNIETLRDFGMKLVCGQDLYATCISGSPTESNQLIVEDTTLAEKKESVVNTALSVNSSECVLDKKVISRTDILQIRNAKVVKIPAGSIITGYAAEAAKEFGLQIIRI